MIKQATLDLLDADLRGGIDKYKGYSFEDRHKLYTHDVRIDPYWAEKKYKQVTLLKWSRQYRFAEHPDFEKIIKTDDIGIYIMYVKPPTLIEDMPQYVMYIGISGEHGSSRPLRERLMDYFHLSKVKIRNNVHKMLQMYYDYVYIKFALFDDDYVKLEALETTLHEYFYPKFGKRDFEPKTKKAHSAWKTGQ